MGSFVCCVVQDIQPGADLGNSNITMGHHYHHHHHDHHWHHRHACAVSEEIEAGMSNATAVYHDNSTRAVVQAFWLNFLTLVGQLVAFSVLMRFKHLAQVLAPRWHLPPPALLVGWAWKAYKETHPRRRNGHVRRMLYSRLNNLDGAVMVRFCVLGFKYTAAGSFLCLFLVPWYMTNDTDTYADSFNRYNLANLYTHNGERRSTRFWAVVVSAYSLVALFTHFALEEWRIFVEMRRAHFARLAGVDAAKGFRKPDPGAAQALRSVLLERVPASARALDGSGVDCHFQGLFPAGDEGKAEGAHASRIHSCVVQAETGFLYRRPQALLASAGRKTLFKFRSALQERLEHATPALDMFEEQDYVGSSTPPNLARDDSSDSELGACSLGQQALDVICALIRRTRQAVILIYTVLIGSWNAGDQTMGSSTAFLTFYSVADRVTAEQLVLDGKLLYWHASRAPEACDLVWPNMALPTAKVMVQSFLVSAMFIVLLLFWSIPVASLQVYIKTLVPVVFHRLIELGVFGKQLYAFLASYLPVLALIGLQYLLPAVFDFLARNMEGMKSNSQIQRRVLQTYFQFQLATLYVTVFSGSLLAGTCEILQNPASIFYILQNKVPQVATYFISFVMARAGLSTPMLLLFPLLTVPGCGGGQAEGEKAETESEPVRPNYAMEASNLGMVLVIGMTYSCVAPLIMPACMVFFLLSGLVYRWLFLYVYTPEFTCDGGIWYELFNGSMVGLLLGTLSLTGSTGVYCGFESFEFVAALLLVCLVVAIHRLFQVYYSLPSQVISLEDAREMDRVYYSLPSQVISLEDAREMDRVCQGVISEWLKDDYYIDPVIKGHPEHSASIASALASAMGTVGCCNYGRPRKATEELEEEDSDTSTTEDESASLTGPRMEHGTEAPRP